MRTFLTTMLLAAAAPSLGAQQPLTARDSAFHVLNRLAYGPTPGQTDSVARLGVMRWVDAQLSAKQPDPGLAERERSFLVLNRSSADLAGMYGELRRERAATKGDSMSGARTPSDLQREARRLQGELGQLAVVRAVYAEDQLQEVMTDFWVNHFNVFANKGADRYLLPGYIERTIRPLALGRFEDLLIATAKSPAMLFYLDNASSVAPGSSPPALRARRKRAAPLDSARAGVARRVGTGINENYARELMELHTLGVDGGYTQQDVIAVARILTGWSIDRPAQGGEFRFNAWAHDGGEKTVLGTAFPAGRGEDEGMRLLRMLAANPATARHVSGKLCARFVSDIHSGGCEDAAVAAWKRTGGDMREVLRAIFTSQDFWSAANVAAKIKTPLEFVVSSVRAVGGTPDSTLRLAQVVGRLGEPLYLQSSPAGYPERQDDWVNSGALLARMNAAVGLAADRLPGVTADLDMVSPASASADALIDAIDAHMLGGRMTAHTREVIRRELATVADPAARRTYAVGLALGSPEFQRQ